MIVPALIVAGSGVYLYYGGRLSIAFVVCVSYYLFFTESGRKRLDESRFNSNAKGRNKLQQKNAELQNGSEEQQPLKSRKKTCCSGKGHGTGSGGCCGGKGHGANSGGCCGGKGHGEKKEKQEETKDIQAAAQSTDQEDFDWGSIATDFTSEFSKGAKSKPRSRTNVKDVSTEKLSKSKSETVKTFKANEGRLNAKQGVKNRETGNSNVYRNDGLIKKALTVSREALLNSDIYVFYSTLQGATEGAAKLVLSTLESVEGLKKSPTFLNLDELNDIDKYFLDVPSENALYILVVPSYDVDCPLDFFIQELEENFNDFRIDRYPLRKLVGYTVLGLGDSESWPDKFCYQASKIDYWLSHLGARRIFPLGKVCVKYDGNAKVEEWAKLLGDTLEDDDPIIYEYDEDIDASDEESLGGQGEDGKSGDSPLSDAEVDVEDLGKRVTSNHSENSTEVKQMVAKDSPTYNNLRKQGYRIVGSHSGVKICRWTKNELRGKGSCYKKSLFNIASSRCMELSPSLACSSKCVFCWRHGTNPVSKNWRWETDDPEYILENALKEHYSMIKQMRGVPGVIADRFMNAFKVAHCALSLVGEPILYPHISKFVELLHQREISSFLVCNAQHPEQLRQLGKVTQLYASIDAPTKDELKRVDRPLYRDFWERMLECLDIMRTTQAHQRTVFRLTLVKDFNMDHIPAYADLIERGMPCFIEIKGATYSGSTKDNVNPLTMQNIPYNEECKNFAEKLVAVLKSRSLDYDVAAEHAHSNCILIAHTKFRINGEWHTHIDFERFFELLKSGENFTHMDYMAKTPEWALYGNGGFAPGNVREIRREKKLQKGSEGQTDIDKSRIKNNPDLPSLPKGIKV